MISFYLFLFVFFETRPKGEEEEEDERNKMMWEGLLIVCLLLLNFFFLFFFSFWPLPSRLLFRRIFLFQVFFFFFFILNKKIAQVKRKRDGVHSQKLSHIHTHTPPPLKEKKILTGVMSIKLFQSRGKMSSLFFFLFKEKCRTC